MPQSVYSPIRKGTNAGFGKRSYHRQPVWLPMWSRHKVIKPRWSLPVWNADMAPTLQKIPSFRSVRSLPATFRHGSRSNVVDKLQRYASNVGACLSWMQTGLQRYTINRNERRAVALRSSVKRKSRTRALLSRRHFFRSAQEAT